MRRPLAAAGAALLALSLSLLMVATMQGEVSPFLLFIIPVLTITGPLGAAGALLLPVAILLLFVSLLPARPRSMESTGDDVGETGTRWGGAIMLGPVPIPFGWARGQWWLIPLAIGAALLLLLILLL